MSDVDDRWYRTTDAGSKVKTSRHGVGKRWAARWRDDDGKQRSLSFDRKLDAERHLAVVEADTLRSAYVDPRDGRVTFGVFAEQWRAAQSHRDTTRAQIETHFRRHVYPTFGPRPLNSVRPSEVQAWVRGLSMATDDRAALAPATIEVIYRYVSAVFRAAVRDRRIATSPCVDITRPRIAPKRVEPPAGAAVAAIRAAMRPDCQASVTLGAGTGLRQGEAFGLEVDCIDFGRRMMLVRQQLVTMPGEPPYLAPPKTDTSYREVPLSDALVEALRAHLEAYPPVPVPIEDRTSHPARTRPARLVFTSRGQPWRRYRFADEVWRPARVAAGLPDDLTYHALRHYFASALIRFGESVKTVQKRLGHAKATETLDTYGHLWPDSEDRTRQAVDLALATDVRQMCADSPADQK